MTAGAATSGAPHARNRRPGATLNKPSSGPGRLLLTALAAAASCAAPAAGQATINVVPSFYIVLRGTAGGIANPQMQKALAFQVTGGAWWSRPLGSMGAPLTSEGRFVIAFPADVAAAAASQTYHIFIVPGAFLPPTVAGLPALPGSVASSALATSTLTWPPGSGAAPTPTPPPPGGGTGGGTTTGTIAVAAPPAVGTGADIAGRVTGLTAPATHQIAAFVNAAGGTLWGPKVTAPLTADGSFSLAGWATDPNDLTAASVTLVVTALGAQLPMVLGTALPAGVTTLARGSLAVNLRPGTGGGGGVVPTPPPGTGGGVTPPPDTGTGGEIAWPPSETPTNRVAPAGGFINWSGYRWIVKDSRGGAVGPGDNVFIGDGNYVWTDSWGLHLNYRPRDGCGGYAASEIWLDRPLGYGTYLLRGIGPVEHLDAAIVWSPMFTWADGPDGNGPNGYRELDFEYARWGNRNDPTSSQFVVMPLRTTGMVPGWRVRYRTPTTTMPTFGGTGQGGGGCNEGGDTGFNGAAISRMTHVMVWHADELLFFTLAGLWQLADVQRGIDAGRLAASYRYPAANNWAIPQPGDARMHANLWHAAGGRGAAPFNGRRVHVVEQGFEFTATRQRFPAVPDRLNINDAGW